MLGETKTAFFPGERSGGALCKERTEISSEESWGFTGFFNKYTMASFNADVQAAIHGEMDSETDMDDTVGDSEDEDLLLQQASRIQSKSRCIMSIPWKCCFYTFNNINWLNATWTVEKNQSCFLFQQVRHLPLNGAKRQHLFQCVQHWGKRWVGGIAFDIGAKATGEHTLPSEKKYEELLDVLAWHLAFFSILFTLTPSDRGKQCVKIIWFRWELKHVFASR